jgi:hypothetical protein
MIWENYEMSGGKSRAWFFIAGLALTLKLK